MPYFKKLQGYLKYKASIFFPHFQVYKAAARFFFFEFLEKKNYQTEIFPPTTNFDGIEIFWFRIEISYRGRYCKTTTFCLIEPRFVFITTWFSLKFAVAEKADINNLKKQTIMSDRFVMHVLQVERIWSLEHPKCIIKRNFNIICLKKVNIFQISIVY